MRVCCACTESKHSYAYRGVRPSSDNQQELDLLPHSSHLLQPLDVSRFATLKQAYGRQVEHLIHMHINYVTKLEFLRGFCEGFYVPITEKNIQGDIAEADFAPLDPQRLLAKLDVHLRTATHPNSRSSTGVEGLPWTSRALHNRREANAQVELIKTRISRYHGSSITSMLCAVDQFAKDAKVMMRQVALLHIEACLLR